MQSKMCEDYLKKLCANCAADLRKVKTKRLNILHKLDDNARTPNMEEVTNLEAFSVISGIPLFQLKSQMIRHFRTEFDVDLKKTEFERELNLNFTLCEKCSLIYTNMYSIHKSFRKFTDSNSLIAKTLRNIFISSESENVCDVSHIKSEYEEDQQMDPKSVPESYDHDMYFSDLERVCDDNDTGSSIEHEMKYDPLIEAGQHPLPELHSHSIVQCDNEAKGSQEIVDVIEGEPENQTFAVGYSLNNKYKISTKCYRCGTSFSSINKLQKHLEEDHLGEINEFHEHIDGPPFLCPLCRHPYRFFRKLQYHALRIHKVRISEKSRAKPPTFNCHLCPCNFLQIDKLNEHYILDHRVTLIGCQHCKKGFNSFRELQNHYAEKHLPNSPHLTCSVGVVPSAPPHSNYRQIKPNHHLITLYGLDSRSNC